MRRFVLTIIAGLAAALIGPSAALAVPTGSITGTVTDAATELPLAGVRVCAVSEGAFEELEEFCAHSGPDGSYVIGELTEAEYRVEFLAGVEGVNYVYQAWKDKPERFDANLVSVTGGEVSGIDAALAEGGRLGGRVTSASSGAPISGIEVCAEPLGEHVDGCAVTNPVGEYTIVGLSADRYRVQFIPPAGVEFLEQYFDAEPGILQADPVKVTVGQLTPNVNATLLEGGQIGGTVTDAISHAPVADVSACTFATLGNEDIGGCAETDTSGHYLIRRVPTGVYTIRFFTPEGYAPRWYTGGACGRDAVEVTVRAGALTGGIDVGLLKSGVVEYPVPACESHPEPPPKPKKCRKGFKRKKVKGKQHCVKVHRKRKHPRSATPHRARVIGAL